VPETESRVKRIGITGASGFVGSAVIAALLKRGDAVRAFTRNPSAKAFPDGVEVRQLELMSETDPVAAAESFAGLDAVVHLSGETVAGRWTAAKKRLIRDSRRISTHNLVAALRACSQRPRTLVCASASGYYGSRGDEPLTEDAAPGDDFLARVCVDWEDEANAATSFGTRVICMRQGLVLGRDGGALAAMLGPFRACAGGPLGSGAQWWPWIHLEDDVALILFALDRDDVAGPVNAVSPDIASNARFSQALGHALRRPSLAFAPAPALRIVLGEFSETLLASQLMLPAKAEDLGFVWRHDSLDEALLDLLDPRSGRAAGTTGFVSAERVAARPDAAFAFFSRPENLEALTPPRLGFHMLTPPPIEMGRGTIVEYDLRVHGVPVRWKTLIARCTPGVGFVDYQLRGPYLLWRHRHDFEADGDGTIVRDTVDYALPLAPLSAVALPLVRGDVRRIFEYRRTRLGDVLGR
jgi:uncharacterized protein